MGEQKFDQMLNQLKARVVISAEKINSACSVWTELGNSIRESSKAFDNRNFPVPFSDSFDKYISLKRLSSESLDISNFHENQDGNTAVKTPIVIDAQLFGAYAEVENPVALRGFDFFETEWDDDYDYNTKLDYAQSVLWKIFTSEKPIALTNSARTELAGTAAYFMRPKNEQVDYSQVRKHNALKAAAGLEDLYSRQDALGVMKFSPKDRHDFLNQGLKDISFLYSISSVYQTYAIARLNKALKSSKNLVPLEIAIGHQDFGLTPKHRKILRKMVAAIHSDSRIYYKAKTQIRLAYMEYKARCEGDTNFRLRQGVRDNLNALLDIHIVNSALDILGSEVSFTYVTLNTQVSAFLTGFAGKDLSVKLLHPRNLFFQESRNAFQSKKNDFNTFASYASGFSSRSNANDNKIDKTELSSMEEHLLPLCKDVQAFHVSLLDDVNPDTDNVDYKKIIGEIRKYFNDVISYFAEDNDSRIPLTDEEEQKINRALSNVEKLDDIFTNLTTKVRDEFEVSDNLDVFISVLEKLNSKKHDAIPILVRGFSPGSDENEFSRLTCLPLAGQYRYLFAIHNTAVIKIIAGNLGDGLEGCQPIQVKAKTFFESVKNACYEIEENTTNIYSDTDKEKAKVLRHFMSAYHSASQGDWAMAELVINKLFEQTKNLEVSDEDQPAIHMILHESYFLKHMILRARSQLAFSANKRLGLLELAMQSLQKSCDEMVSVDKTLLSNGYDISVLSVRVGLSQVATASEWIHQITVQHPASEKTFSLLSNTSKDPFFAWASEYGCPRSISSVSITGDIGKLQKYLVNIFNKLKSVYSEKMKNDAKFVFWNQNIGQTTKIHDFLTLVGFLAVQNDFEDQTFQADDQDSSSNSTVSCSVTEAFLLKRENKVVMAHRDRLNKVMKDLKTPRKIYETYGPLSKSIVSFYELQEMFCDAENGLGRVDSPTARKMMEKMEALEEACSRLDSNGLPRHIIRKTKKICAKELAVVIKGQLNRLDETYIHPVLKLK